MGTSGFITRAQRRRRRRATVVLFAIISVVGGLSIALIAGASRTRSVVDRYFAPGTSYDVEAGAAGVTIEQVRAMPGVQGVHRQGYIGAVATRRDGTESVLNLFMIEGPPWNPMIRVRQGEMPAIDDVLSMAVNQQTADDFGLRLGDELPLRLFLTEQDFAALQAGNPQASGAELKMRVAAIVDTPDDFGADLVFGGSQASNHTVAAVPLAFYEHHVAKRDMGDFGYGFEVDLATPGSLDAFERAFTDAGRKVPANDPVLSGRPSGVSGVTFNPPPWSNARATFTSPAQIQATVLLVLGLTIGVAGVIVIALVLGADERLFAHEQVVLAALGMPRSQRSRLSLRRSLSPIVGGAVGAAVIAVALSGLFPVGSVRPLERNPGVDVNWAIFGGGCAGVVVACSLVAITVGRLSTRARASRPARPAAAAHLLIRLQAPIEVMLGGHFAFPGPRAGRVVPSWQAIGAGVVAVIAVLGVSQYSGGIEHLRFDKAAHGFTSDAMIGNVNFQLTDESRSELHGDARFSSAADARFGSALVDGESTEVLAFVADDPGLAPAIIAGRAPRTRGEIALGTHLMKRLAVGIGDTVTLSLSGSEMLDQGSAQPPPEVELTIVGSSLVASGLGRTDAADAATLTMDALLEAGASPAPQMVLVQYAPGLDKTAAANDLRHRYPLWMTTDSVSAKIDGLWRGRVLPISGALVIAVLAAVLLAYTLATAARVTRQEMGVLRALGIDARGLRNAVIWQGLLIAGVVLVFGIPLGFITGRFVWRLVADRLGVSGYLPLSPWLLLVVPLTALLAVAAAAIPARRARHIRVTEVLRVE